MLKNLYNELSACAPVLGTVLAMLGLSSITLSVPVQAVELSPERTFFDRAPELVSASASQYSQGKPSTYYFTITIPETAGESLEAITVTQKTNGEEIEFDLSESQAFRGGLQGQPIPLSQIGSSQPQENQVTLVFEELVSPGSTVTVAVDVNENPAAGMYEFDVTAFSEGEKSPGLSLGTRHITFTPN